MKPGRHSLKAVILSRTNYGEADLIVGFLTREQGKISGLAKHARKSRKRFGAVLSSPALVELAFVQTRGRDLVRLDKGEVVRSFGDLSGDVYLLALASQAMELADAFCAPLDPAPEIFDLLVWCLGRLEHGPRPEETMFIYQLRLLGLSGFAPSLSACSVCGRRPEPGKEFRLKPNLGGLVCRDCSPGGFPAGPGTIKLMVLIQGLGQDKIDRVRVTSQTQAEGGPFLMALIRHTLGRDLKTARFLDQMAKKTKRI